jgi:hypothetical protein
MRMKHRTERNVRIAIPGDIPNLRKRGAKSFKSLLQSKQLLWHKNHRNRGNAAVPLQVVSDGFSFNGTAIRKIPQQQSAGGRHVTKLNPLSG